MLTKVYTLDILHIIGKSLESLEEGNEYDDERTTERNNYIYYKNCYTEVGK